MHRSGLLISAVTARQILDSRGNPTIQVALHLGNGVTVQAAAPAGASTGVHEAVELRDGGPAYGGRGVQAAVATAEGAVADLITIHPWHSLAELDYALRELDGTENAAKLGGNTMVAVSMAASRGFALMAQLPLHQWIATITGSTERMPVPHFNVLNGGAHAVGELDFQEFMIAPVGATSFEAAMQCGTEVYHALAARIRHVYKDTGLGDEGGFAPRVARPEEALGLLGDAIADAGYTPAVSAVAVALDPAANGFRVADGYCVAGEDLTSTQLLQYYVRLVDSFPIHSIEDGFAENDESGWRLQFEHLASRIQLVGDDLYVTDPARIARGAVVGLSNAVLIKPNQIGTVTQTFEAIHVARNNGMACMVSHRSGETLDTFIADLAVGTGVGQIKAGAPARGERVAKYNRLSEIAHDHPNCHTDLTHPGHPTLRKELQHERFRRHHRDPRWEPQQIRG